MYQVSRGGFTLMAYFMWSPFVQTYKLAYFLIKGLES